MYITNGDIKRKEVAERVRVRREWSAMANLHDNHRRGICVITECNAEQPGLYSIGKASTA